MRLGERYPEPLFYVFGQEMSKIAMKKKPFPFVFIAYYDIFANFADRFGIYTLSQNEEQLWYKIKRKNVKI